MDGMNSVANQMAALDQLRALRSPTERLSWLVGLARQRPTVAAAERIDRWRVPGCLSQLWVVGDCRDGRCHFRCDSDSQVVKAVAGFLCDRFNGQSPEAILAADLGFLERPELQRLLTSNRRNALNRVCEFIQAFAAQQVEAREVRAQGTSQGSHQP
jgi:cysteine desulfuration protein SufE